MKTKVLGVSAAMLLIFCLAALLWPKSGIEFVSKKKGFTVYRAAWSDQGVEDDCSPNFLTHWATKLNQFTRKHQGPAFVFSITGAVFTHCGFPYVDTAFPPGGGLIIYSEGGEFSHGDPPELVDSSGHSACPKIDTFNLNFPGSFAVTRCPMATIANGTYHLRHGTNELAEIHVRQPHN